MQEFACNTEGFVAHGLQIKKRLLCCLLKRVFVSRGSGSGLKEALDELTLAGSSLAGWALGSREKRSLSAHLEVCQDEKKARGSLCSRERLVVQPSRVQEHVV